MARLEEHKNAAGPAARSANPIMDARVAFVTNVASHYRTKVFQALSRMCNIEFCFYSDGGEWYWQKAHGSGSRAGFVSHCFPGFWVGGTRIVPGLIPLLLRRGYNVFVSCLNGRFSLPVTYLVARFRRAPFILWATIWHRLETPFHRLIFPLTRYFYLHADALVVYGEHGRQYLISEGVDPARIFVAPQSVDNDAYSRPVPAAEQQEIRARHDIREDRKVVLYLGRLEAGKGLEYLLEAFSQLPQRGQLLVLCGTGSEEGNLRALARRLGIEESTRFTGHVAANEAVLYYSLAWVAVLPSVTTPNFKEPWGLTVNEAFNQAVPVIATDAVGAAAGGLLCNGRNGFVVPERNTTALRDALELTLANEDLRNRLGKSAAAEVSLWTQERTAAGFRDAVAFVMAGKKEATRNA